MEYEVVISIYEKDAPEGTEPVREECLLDATSLSEANELVEDALELVEDEPDDGAETLDAGSDIIQ